MELKVKLIYKYLQMLFLLVLLLKLLKLYLYLLYISNVCLELPILNLDGALLKKNICLRVMRLSILILYRIMLI